MLACLALFIYAHVVSSIGDHKKNVKFYVIKTPVVNYGCSDHDFHVTKHKVCICLSTCVPTAARCVSKLHTDLENQTFKIF